MKSKKTFQKKANADVIEIVVVIVLVAIGLLVSSLFVASLSKAKKKVMELKSQFREAQEQLLLFLNAPAQLEDQTLPTIDVALYAYYYWKQHHDDKYFKTLPFALLDQRVSEERSYWIQFLETKGEEKTLIYQKQGDHFNLFLIREQAHLDVPVGEKNFTIIYYESYFKNEHE